MSERDAPQRMEMPEELMLRRLTQSEEMHDFFIQMWLQNPQLARQGGDNVRGLLSTMSAPPNLPPGIRQT